MDQQSPGFVQALIEKLRGRTGMTGTTDPSAAGAYRTLQQVPQDRDLQIRAAEMGMTPEQYQQMLIQSQGLR
jgi:hypothetical protein